MTVHKRSKRAGKERNAAVTTRNDKKPYGSRGHSHTTKRTELIAEKTVKKWKGKHRRESASSELGIRLQESEHAAASHEGRSDAKKQMGIQRSSPPVAEVGQAGEYDDEDIDEVLERCLDEVMRACEQMEKQEMEDCGESFPQGTQNLTKDQQEEGTGEDTAVKWVSSDLEEALERQRSDSEERESATDITDTAHSQSETIVQTETQTVIQQPELDPIIKDITTIERLGRRRYTQVLHLVALAHSKPQRTRNPHRGVWPLYSSAFYNRWKHSNATPTQDLQTYPQPGLSVVWERCEVSAHSRKRDYKRVYILLRIGHLQLCTKPFNLQNHITSRLGHLVEATEVQENRKGLRYVYDVEIMFLGKGFLRLRVPAALGENAVGKNSVGASRKLGRHDGIVFYGKQITREKDEDVAGDDDLEVEDVSKT